MRACRGCGVAIEPERHGSARYCYACRPARQEKVHPSGRDFPVAVPDPEFGPRELVRVTLWLDRQAVEDLELMVRYRLGPRSRSELVREAIGWWRAKNAAWIIRARDIDRRRAERDAETARALAVGREQRDQERGQGTLAGALAIARRAAENVSTGG